MRSLILSVALLLITFADVPSAEAGRRARQNRGYDTGRYGYSTGGYQTAPQQRPYRAWRGGFFDRLLEFERRKNEFFFGWMWR